MKLFSINMILLCSLKEKIKPKHWRAFPTSFSPQCPPTLGFYNYNGTPQAQLACCAIFIFS
jgi:hypothetical protein